LSDEIHGPPFVLSARVAFSGSVSTMGLDEVIAFLAKNGLEGVLTVTGAELQLRLCVHASRLLIPPVSDSGRLNQKALQAIRRRARAFARPENEKPKRRLRRTKSGSVSADNLDGILARASEVQRSNERDQAAEDVHALFLWEEARFTFEPGRLSKALLRRLEGEGLILDCHALLMEVARRADERQASQATRGGYEACQKSGTRVAERPRHRRRTTPMGVVSGDLDGVGLGALLEDLRANRRTGTLTVRAGERVEPLYFSRGNAFVLHEQAGDAFAREFLGDAAETVSSLAGNVDEADLCEDVSRELKERFWDLLLCEGASFRFQPAKLPLQFFMPSRGTAKVALETERFLLHAIGRVGEWEEILRVLGGTRTVYRFASSEQKLHSVRQIADFLILVDGRLSFEEIARRAGLSRLEAGRVMAALVRDGTLAPCTPTRPVRRPVRRRRRAS
jgi:hypothetical protein